MTEIFEMVCKNWLRVQLRLQFQLLQSNFAIKMNFDFVVKFSHHTNMNSHEEYFHLDAKRKILTVKLFYVAIKTAIKCKSS
jgi:hypothetical protein